MIYLYWIALAAVILGHFFFAYAQSFRWPALCEKLTDLRGEEIQKTATLGFSFASYNAAIGIGLCCSFLLPAANQSAVQAVVLALIVVTASVGARVTHGNTILFARLLPAVVSLLLLLAS